MTANQWLLIFLGPWLVIVVVSLIADPRATLGFLLRPLSRPRPRPVTRPRPARAVRWAVA